MFAAGVGLIYLVLGFAIGIDPDVGPAFLVVVVGAGILFILSALILRGNALRRVVLVLFIGGPALLGLLAKPARAEDAGAFHERTDALPPPVEETVGRLAVWRASFRPFNSCLIHATKTFVRAGSSRACG